MDLNDRGSEVVGYRRFLLSKYIWNNWYTIAPKGVRLKPPKDINNVLVECN